MVGGGTSPGAAGAPPGAHLAAAAGGREEKARLVEASSRREAPTCVPANALLKIVSIAFLKINILVQNLTVQAHIILSQPEQVIHCGCQLIG